MPRTIRNLLLITAVSVLLGTACTSLKPPVKSAQTCFENNQQNYNQVLHCYQQEQASTPLNYRLVQKSTTDGIEQRYYELTSQQWSPQGIVTPEQWLHRVTITIPNNALNHHALLVINNGVRVAPQNASAPLSAPLLGNDFSEETIASIAKQTRTIIVSINSVPNQPLLYQGEDTPKSEDVSVAYTWQKFLESPQKNTFMPLQIPAMAAASRAMDLAEVELKPFSIKSFLVTGISKRGWTAWHTAIADKRVEGIVPFVFDALDFQAFMQHTYQSYGKNWPIALAPYYFAGIPQQQNTEAFDKLLQITDPIHYLKSPFAARLQIPKYIVNASGDDFFPADSANLYINQLPGETSLRVVPNSDHAGIRKHTEQSLVGVINRWQKAMPLPSINSELSSDNTLSLTFSEPPTQLIQWTANNPYARDFRYACGIQYDANPLTVPPATANASGAAATTVIATIPTPAQGWSASFVEARFGDGTIVTTPVTISPNTVYPDTAPPAFGKVCRTLAPPTTPTPQAAP